MSIAAQMAAGTFGIAIGIALVWYGIPDRRRERHRILRGETMEMLYPVLVLAFLVLGGTTFLTALF